MDFPLAGACAIQARTLPNSMKYNLIEGVVNDNRCWRVSSGLKNAAGEQTHSLPLAWKIAVEIAGIC
jgi:hypothetical protein